MGIHETILYICGKIYDHAGDSIQLDGKGNP